MPQFHHYVPRFILRKWSTTKVTEERQRRVKKKKGYQTIRTRREEDVVSTYDPASDTLSVDATFVASSYGFMDLYKDEQGDDPYEIEKLFSKLESQAAVVIRKLENAGTSITLPRQDVNTLRKFLFLMTYRNGSRSRQFMEDQFDAMTRKSVEDCRRAHGLKDFRAVWMLNIRNILISEHWEVSTNQDILQSDRSSYNLQMQHMQLGIFSAPDDCQFILTENGFGLYEGAYVPALTMMGMLLSPEIHPVHTAFPHTFTWAVSPKLVLILRGHHMTQEQHLINQGVSRDQARPQLFGHTLTDSFFADFPRSFAHVTYNPSLPPGALEQYLRTPEIKNPTIEDSLKLPMVDGRPIMSRLGDKLQFQIHRLSKAQAEKVNSLLLTNNRGVITFKSPSALLSSLEAYERGETLSSSGPPLGQPRFDKISFWSLKKQLREVLGSVRVGANTIPAETTTSSPAASSSKAPEPTSSTPINVPISEPHLQPQPQPAPPVVNPSSPSTPSGSSNQAKQRGDISSSLPGLRGAFSSRPRKTT